MSLRKRIVVAALAACSSAQCATPPAATIEGRTYAQWVADADPRSALRVPRGMEVDNWIWKLTHLAPQDVDAERTLERAASDRDENLRGVALGALVEVAGGARRTTPDARASLARLALHADPEVARDTGDAALRKWFVSDEARLGSPQDDALLDAFVRSSERRVAASLDWEDLESALTLAATLTAWRPELGERLALQLDERPLADESPAAGYGYSRFAWSWIDPDGEAPADGRALQLAHAAARRATRLQPDNADFWDTCAMAAWRVGERAEAEACARRACELAERCGDEDLPSFEVDRRFLALDEAWSDGANTRPRRRFVAE